MLNVRALPYVGIYTIFFSRSINFARIGFDISQALLEATFLFGEQYKAQQYSQNYGTTGESLKNRKFSTESTDCFERLILLYQINVWTISIFKNTLSCRYIDETDRDIPYDARISLLSQILSGRFALNALNTFLHNVHTNTPIPEAILQDGLSYTQLGLQTDKRQAGLRQYDHGQLFSLAFMQRSCGYSHGDYYEYKPYIEGEVDELFRLVLFEVQCK